MLWQGAIFRMDDTGNSARILVVDDIPDTLNLLTNWLDMHGYQTLHATSGRQAIQQAVEHLPDAADMWQVFEATGEDHS